VLTMSSAVAADKLIKDLGARSNFVEKQRAAAMSASHVELLQASQVAKIISIIAKSKLDADDGARVTDVVHGGLWSDEQKHNMNVAVANAVAECDGDDTSSRKQQYASYPERLITASDVASFKGHQGDETMSCMTTGSRMFRAGIGCPSEKLKMRLGAVAMVMGGLDLAASAAEKKRIANKVRTCIKRFDSKGRHPLAQLLVFPDDVNDLDGDRFQYAGFTEDPPADLDPDVVRAIDSVLVETAARCTNMLVTPRPSRQSPLQLDVAGRTPEGAAMGMGMMSMQDMMRMQQMQQAMLMQMMCGGGPPPGPATLQHCFGSAPEPRADAVPARLHERLLRQPARALWQPHPWRWRQRPRSVAKRCRKREP
jgi:hypothetical protein